MRIVKEDSEWATAQRFLKDVAGQAVAALSLKLGKKARPLPLDNRSPWKQWNVGFQRAYAKSAVRALVRVLGRYRGEPVYFRRYGNDENSLGTKICVVTGRGVSVRAVCQREMLTGLCLYRLDMFCCPESEVL